ncbi:RNA polymerase factor sigma-32 [Aquibium sp. ELW1220]|jgi:RNA polymerase sigma-32 factor|uniref:RNA polymerase factor sigma-32 n=1 Tax=Aquibium sp. ELW1220 TaxID=2976766 RepID=UPI0025B1AC56|nr:RNA polymerase factor sigma-32 [Aquibium sp. ELW1220]MDN2579884.1 RNA polymerase factor sigma-32 [Aquibium sp. ELW1220]
MNGEPAGTSMISAARKAPYLDRVEEHELAVRWKEKRDQEALHRITMAHMRLVISMATKFRYFGLPLSDLIQEGHVGLLEAAARFEPDREVRFSTYATWWIRASMQDYILRNWSIVRGGTSSAQKALFFNLRRLRARLAQGSEPLRGAAVYKEIADAIGVSVSDVALMDSRLSGPDTSLNAPLSDDGEAGSERMDFLVSDAPTPDEVVTASVDDERRVLWLNRALSVLNDRELRIIRERRLRDEGATLESLGEKLGISKERVRQIENRAMQKLRTALLKINPDMAPAMM